MQQVHTWEYRGLLTTAGSFRSQFTVWVWTHWWVTRTPRMRGQSRITLHGRTVRVNTGFAYPAFMRRWPRYNAPLVDLVQALKRRRSRTLTIVDVGAAVGDTVLLLVERTHGFADTYICIEPDSEFYDCLRENVAHLPHVEVRAEMLSDSRNAVPELVRTHSGTASAQGEAFVSAITLDEVIDGRHVDVIKIDTDGFDGRVLAGAERT